MMSLFKTKKVVHYFVQQDLKFLAIFHKNQQCSFFMAVLGCKWNFFDFVLQQCGYFFMLRWVIFVKKCRQTPISAFFHKDHPSSGHKACKKNCHQGAAQLIYLLSPFSMLFCCKKQSSTVEAYSAHNLGVFGSNPHSTFQHLNSCKKWI